MTATARHGVLSRDQSEASTLAASPEALFEAHFDDVYRAVAHMLGPGAQGADIEDVSQQVFLAAHRSFGSFRGDCKPMTWLYGIAHNCVLTYLRSRRRRLRLQQAIEQQSAHTGVDESLELRGDVRDAWQHLMRIKPKKRLVFVLAELEGLTGGEIARALGIPEKTVWTRLHHARIELGRRLQRSQDKT